MQSTGQHVLIMALGLAALAVSCQTRASADSTGRDPDNVTGVLIGMAYGGLNATVTYRPDDFRYPGTTPFTFDAKDSWQTRIEVKWQPLRYVAFALSADSKSSISSIEGSPGNGPNGLRRDIALESRNLVVSFIGTLYRTRIVSINVKAGMIASRQRLVEKLLREHTETTRDCVQFAEALSCEFRQDSTLVTEQSRGETIGGGGVYYGAGAEAILTPHWRLNFDIDWRTIGKDAYFTDSGIAHDEVLISGHQNIWWTGIAYRF